MQLKYNGYAYERVYTFNTIFKLMLKNKISNEMLKEAKRVMDIHKKLSIPYLQMHLQVSAFCAKSLIQLLYDEKIEDFDEN